MKQTQVIGNILKKRGSVTNFYAIHNRISLRLGARIFDLRAKGWKIKTVKMRDRNTKYVLLAKPKR